jgi:cell division protein FtsW
LAAGITALISAQLLINIAVVTGSIPPTGIPLPFISAGGTSLMVFMGAIGVLMNIANNERLNFQIKGNVFKNIRLSKNKVKRALN